MSIYTVATTQNNIRMVVTTDCTCKRKETKQIKLKETNQKSEGRKKLEEMPTAN
jgi:hypothetical protein